MKNILLIVGMLVYTTCFSQTSKHDSSINMIGWGLDPRFLTTETMTISSGISADCDSLARALKLQNFRLNRIKFYLNICLKHPKQDKFLKGWIKRAIQ